MTSPSSALRYSYDYEAVRSNPYGRNWLLIEAASTGKSILELGCADGFISRHLKERGCDVTGVEVDAEAAALARQWCDRVVVADLNRPGWAQQVGRGFDTVLCGDVLEHLVSPAMVLRQIRQVLTSDGRVIVCVPNIAHLRVRLKLLLGKFDYQSTGILDFTHLRFFTYKTARELIEGAGYRIISYQPCLGGGAMTRWLRRIFHRMFAGSMLFVAVPEAGEGAPSCAPAVDSAFLPAGK